MSPQRSLNIQGAAILSQMNPLASQNRSIGALINRGDALQRVSLLLGLIKNGPSLIASAYVHCSQALILLFYLWSHHLTVLRLFFIAKRAKP
jgi:hypothetical protein